MKWILGFLLPFGMLLHAFAFDGGEAIAPDNPELREQAIQEMVKRTSHYRTVVMGRWNPKLGRYDLFFSNRTELQQNLASLSLTPAQQGLLNDTRDLAVLGASAGGLLYFVPEKKIFFWEGSSSDANNYWSRENLMTSSMTATFLNQLLRQARQDIQDDDGRAFGSQKLGSLFVVVLNPAEALSQKVDEHWRRKIFTEGRTEIVSEPPSPMVRLGPPGVVISNYIGLRFQLVF